MPNCSDLMDEVGREYPIGNLVCVRNGRASQGDWKKIQSLLYPVDGDRESTALVQKMPQIHYFILTTRSVYRIRFWISS